MLDRLGSRGRRFAAGVLRALPGARVPAWDQATWDRSYSKGEWDRLHDLIETPRYGVLASYLRMLNKERPLRILDVGCGEGILRDWLDELPFARYMGTDISSVAVDTATARYSGDRRTEFQCRDALARSLGPFDVVVFNEVLPLAADPEGLVRDAQGLMGPDGIFLVSVWRHRGERKVWGLFEPWCKPLSTVDLRSRSAKSVSCRVACLQVGSDPDFRVQVPPEAE